MHCFLLQKHLIPLHFHCCHRLRIDTWQLPPLLNQVSEDMELGSEEHHRFLLVTFFQPNCSPRAETKEMGEEDCPWRIRVATEAAEEYRRHTDHQMD
jgi:hypothetical protein